MTGSYVGYFPKFSVWQHDMPYALKITVMADLREHVKSCSSTTTNVIFSLLQLTWPPNLAEWWLILRVSHPSRQMTLQKRGHVRSRGKLKLLNILYYNVYCHQTCQGSDIPWGAPTHKFYDFLFTWSCEFKWQIEYVTSPFAEDLRTWN